MNLQEPLVPHAESPPSLCAEAISILKLAVPMFVAMVCWAGMKTTDTALLGHADHGNSTAQYIDASALGDLWMSSTGVFIQGSVLGIFAGQALGAGNKELAGIWFQVSLVVIGMISIPVIVLWMLVAPALEFTGLSHNKELIKLATYYTYVFIICIPLRGISSQVKQYFNAQKIVGPAAYNGILSILTNLVFGLIFVLGYPLRELGWTDPSWHGYGFKACPWVTVGVEIMQVLVLVGIYWWWKQLYRDCWPKSGWSCAHITSTRVSTYLRMYIPAALSIASDFWRLSVIGWFAARMGANEVGAFNASYRILWICLIFAGTLAGATATKLTIAMGQGDTSNAKRITFVGFALAVCTLGGLGVLVFFNSRRLGQIFSDDENFLRLFVEVRLPLAIFMVSMNLAVFLERIPMCMGRAKAVLYCGLAGSWAGQVPAVFLVTRYWRNDLVGLFWGCSLGYIFLSALLAYVIVTSDWEFYAREAAERSETKK